MALGNAAAAHVHLIVWCLDCGHQVELDPVEMAERYGAEMAERYGAEMAVPDWRKGARVLGAGPESRYGRERN
jgi:hypothetical protein